MSPEMLTLVAAVLVYDIARDICDTRSSTVDTEPSPPRLGRRRPDGPPGAPESRRVRSWTRLEKDIIATNKWFLFFSAAASRKERAGESGGEWVAGLPFGQMNFDEREGTRRSRSIRLDRAVSGARS